MITDNSSTKRFYVSITYTNMRAADGSDECALAWTWFWLVLKGLTDWRWHNRDQKRARDPDRAPEDSCRVERGSGMRWGETGLCCFLIRFISAGEAASP